MKPSKKGARFLKKVRTALAALRKMNDEVGEIPQAELAAHAAAFDELATAAAILNARARVGKPVDYLPIEPMAIVNATTERRIESTATKEAERARLDRLGKELNRLVPILEHLAVEQRVPDHLDERDLIEAVSAERSHRQSTKTRDAAIKHLLSLRHGARGKLGAVDVSRILLAAGYPRSQANEKAINAAMSRLRAGGLEHPTSPKARYRRRPVSA